MSGWFDLSPTKHRPPNTLAVAVGPAFPSSTEEGNLFQESSLAKLIWQRECHNLVMWIAYQVVPVGRYDHKLFPLGRLVCHWR